MTIEQTRPDVQTLPLVDISRFRDPARREGFLAELRHAAHDVGFFYVTGHGIPAEVVRTASSRRPARSSTSRSRTGSRSRT